MQEEYSDLIPQWYKDKHPEAVVTSGKEQHWDRSTLFYHITQQHNVEAILSNGLVLEYSKYDQGLTHLIEGIVGAPFGISLDESEWVLRDLVTEAHRLQLVKGERPALYSLLEVVVQEDTIWVIDYEGMPGAIYVLEDIPPWLIVLKESNF